MTKLEYIWVDGTEDAPQLRSKTKVMDEWDGSVAGCPVWGFDGSSTNQAPGNNSDCVLKPVRIYENPLEINSQLVLCEVWNTDDTPHKTNIRWKLHELLDELYNWPVEGGISDEPWFGFEQEYTLYENDRPLGWPTDGEPAPQGDYYCGRNKGESIAREHMDMCIETGVGIVGINSEVMLGQWEYQIFGKDPYKVTDDMWVARWLMEKICDTNGLAVSLDPKPVEGDWNGAGCHTNFSTKDMREEDGDLVIHKAIKKLKYLHNGHIDVYGSGNEKRLTGEHETCPITEFRWGVSDRGASVRIPWQVSKDGKGYLEDRRPSANCDPYLVAWRLIKTICGED
jgi:glutamine synthetase